MITVTTSDLSRIEVPALDQPVGLTTDKSFTGLTLALVDTLQVRRQKLIEHVDQAALSVLLTSGQGIALDKIAALYGVKRMVVIPEDKTASPPVEQVMESDERLRLRARLGLESLSQAGCAGAYLYYALAASALIKDVAVYSVDYQPGTIKLVYLLEPLEPVQAKNTPNPAKADPASQNNPFHFDVVFTFQETMAEENIRHKIEEAIKACTPIVDTVSVKAARVVNYQISARLSVNANVQFEQVKSAVTEKLLDLARKNHRIGKNIMRDEIFAALYESGVELAVLDQPAKDIALNLDQAPKYLSESDIHITELV